MERGLCFVAELRGSKGDMFQFASLQIVRMK